MNPFSFRIFTEIANLPDDWNAHCAQNVFLSSDYLRVLESGKPDNMRCFFIAIYASDKMCGIALAQFLNLSDIESFGDRDSCLKTKIRNVVFKNLSSRVLFVGNNMLTGQNAFALDDSANPVDCMQVLKDAVRAIGQELQLQGLEPHIEVWKDFLAADAGLLLQAGFRSYFKFSTQPNMVLNIPVQWKSFDGYLSALHKKYRDQYKRARKKAEGIEKRRMDLGEIARHQDTIHELYLTVAQNAPFNTFYLPKGHFLTFKQQLKDRFLFYGYFQNGQLIGFNTLIKNGADIDTYFLGYDNAHQRERMLYLNMLYDMIAYSVNKGYKRIIFARTALEIKSSVGAVPVEMFGLIRHNNGLINWLMPKLFAFFEPEMDWQQRHPFKF